MTILIAVLLLGALLYWGAILCSSVRWMWHRYLKWRGGKWALRKELKKTAKILGLKFCPEKVFMGNKAPRHVPLAPDHWAGACYTEKGKGRLLAIWIRPEQLLLPKGRVLRHEMAHAFLENTIAVAVRGFSEEQRREIDDAVQSQAEICARHLEELLTQLADFPKGASQ